MNAQAVQPSGLLQYLIPIAVFAVIFAVRVRRMSQERPLRLERLWVVPALYGALVVSAFVASPPRPPGWLIRAMRITVDPATHRLNQRASPAAMLILLALVGVRMALKVEGSRYGFDAVLLTDALLALALGLFTATRVEMYLRGKRMLSQLTGSLVA